MAEGGEVVAAAAVEDRKSRRSELGEMIEKEKG